MKKLIKSVVEGAVIITTIIGCFTMSGSIKPKYQEFSSVVLTADKESSLDFGDLSLICCYGAEGKNTEFYINNELITDTTDYVIHKTLDFSSDKQDGKLTINSISVDDDVITKALCIKVFNGTEFLEIRNIKNFTEHTFNSLGKTDVYIWLELSKITKEEVKASKGTSISIEFGVK